jgi:tRNA (guanine10-N2)-methyltransferase
MQNFAVPDMSEGSEFLVRFVPQHATFRLPELESCALMSGARIELPLKFVEYGDSLPFAILKLENEETATSLIRRSILVQYSKLVITFI